MIDLDTGELLFESDKDLNIYGMTDKGFVLFTSQTKVRLYPKFKWECSEHDTVKLLKLAPYLTRSNSLYRDGEPMDLDGVGKSIGMSSVTRVYSFMRRMREQGIIKKKGPSFVVNPMYLNASSRIGESLYRLFKAELDPHLSPFIKKEVGKRWPDDTPN